MYPFFKAQTAFTQQTLGGATMSATILNDSNYPDGFTILGLSAVTSNNTRVGDDTFSCSSNGASGKFAVLNASSTRYAQNMILECRSDLRIDTTNSGSHNVTYEVTFIPYGYSEQPQVPTYSDWLIVSLLIVFALTFLVTGFFKGLFNIKHK